MKIKNLHVFDIDGVLLDSSHRFKTLITEAGQEKFDLQHWKENQFRALEDTPLKHAEKYKTLLTRKNTFVIIATSRFMRAVDYQVIAEKLGEPHAYVSRLTDEQKGGLLKLNGVLRIVEDLQLNDLQKVYIYEDNINYLKMLSDGIKQHLQVEPIAYYIPSNQGI